MYRLHVQILDVDNNIGNPIIHEIYGKEVRSIQEAFEMCDGKVFFEGYLELENRLLASLKKEPDKS